MLLTDERSTPERVYISKLLNPVQGWTFLARGGELFRKCGSDCPGEKKKRTRVVTQEGDDTDRINPSLQGCKRMNH